MTVNRPLILIPLLASLLLVACEKNQTPVERAVDKTKDALDIRDHEKLKDAGEDVKDAAKDLKQGAKDAVNDKK
jgi:predicted small secreted protein